VVLYCHSYGSVVCGVAAHTLPRRVTDIAVAGSPGMRVENAAGLHTDARVWSMRDADDWIQDVPYLEVGGLGHGADPVSSEFGARVLAMRKAHLPADSAAIARSLAMLGDISRGAGDLDKAIPLLRESVAIFDKRGEDDRASAIVAHLNLVRALEAASKYDEALQMMAHVLPNTQRSSSQYAGAGGAEVRLMHARLLARARPEGKDCDAIARVLEVAPAGEAVAVEAHVLAADCERRNGRTQPMQLHLAAVGAAQLPPDRLSAYARGRLDDLVDSR
jgi:tetratricopeptide (TPR) repeat protein